jgi:hypothetical protein
MVDRDLHTCPPPGSAPTNPHGGRGQVGPCNPNLAPTPPNGRASWSVLDSIFEHFWSETRVPSLDQSPMLSPSVGGVVRSPEILARPLKWRLPPRSRWVMVAVDTERGGGIAADLL